MSADAVGASYAIASKYAMPLSEAATVFGAVSVSRDCEGRHVCALFCSQRAATQRPDQGDRANETTDKHCPMGHTIVR